MKNAEGSGNMRRVPRILHVDDNEGDLELLEIAFKTHGFPVSLINALDGDQGIVLLEDAVRTGLLPDLVLLDLNMPRVHGTEVLRFIRQHERLQTIPTVILTSSDAGVDRRRCQDLGVNDFVLKPYRMDDYALLIERLKPFIHIDGASGT